MPGGEFTFSLLVESYPSKGIHGSLEHDVVEFVLAVSNKQSGSPFDAVLLCVLEGFLFFAFDVVARILVAHFRVTTVLKFNYLGFIL